MAENDLGDYYYDEGTVNEQLEDYGVFERDGRLFIHDTVNDGVFAALADGLQLGAERGAPDNSDFDNTDQRILYLSDGASVGAAGDLVVARADGSGGVEVAIVASPGTYSAV